jgi:hypothetical protein
LMAKSSLSIVMDVPLFRRFNTAAPIRIMR